MSQLMDAFSKANILVLSFLLIILEICLGFNKASNKLIVLWIMIIMFNIYIMKKFGDCGSITTTIREITLWPTIAFICFCSSNALFQFTLISILIPILIQTVIISNRELIMLCSIGLFVLHYLKTELYDISYDENYFSEPNILSKLINNHYLILTCAFNVLSWVLMQYDNRRNLRNIDDLHTRLFLKDEEIKRLNDRLEIKRSLIENLKLENNRSKEKVEEAIQTQEYMLSSISHGLRNPLNIVMGNLEAAIDEIHDVNILKKIQHALDFSSVLLNLINNFIDAANITTFELNLKKTNMYHLFSKIWSQSTYGIKDKNLLGHMEISKDMPKYLCIDEQRISQIISNLLSNAIKFTDKGDIMLSYQLIQTQNHEKYLQTNKIFRRNMTEHKLDVKNVPDIKSNNDTKSKPHSMAFSRSLLGDFEEQELVNYEFSKEIDRGESCDDIREISDIANEDFEEHATLQSIRNKISPRLLPDVFLRSNTCIFNLNDNSIETKLNETFVSRIQHLSYNKLLNQKSYLRIEIIDTGCGMSTAILEKLGQPFIKEDNTITRKKDGMGLGLYITKKLVAKMNGHIKMYSQKNIGTNIIVMIPIGCNSSKEIEINTECNRLNRPIYEDPTAQSKTILVVDDNLYNQLVLRNCFERLGVKVETASNGLEAFNMYINKEKGYYRFITMDLQMPEIDGLTCSRMIRKYECLNNFQHHIPIVIISGNCMLNERRLCLDPNDEIKAAFFYKKPISYNDCYHIVNALINHNNMG